jgi:hypothetical protein
MSPSWSRSPKSKRPCAEWPPWWLRAPAETLFTVVAEQVAEVLSVPLVSIVRYEQDGTATERASVSAQGTMFRVGTRWSLEGTNVVALVRDSAQPAVSTTTAASGNDRRGVQTGRNPL